MSPLFYKTLHLAGILMVFLAYGGLIVRALYAPEDRSIRRMGAITSGIGLLLLLVSGFGLIHKLEFGFQTWNLLKMLIWVVLGGMIVVINRQPRYAPYLWWITIILGLLATVLAFYKI
jgi:hypothetical protein